MLKKLILFCLAFVFCFAGLSVSAYSAPKPVEISIGYENQPGEPFDLAMHEWARLIELRSNGSIKVKVYPSSQLGSKNELIDQMLAGMGVITLADGAFYADRGVADLGITFGPYLFSTWEQAWTLIESDWWKTQMGLLEKKGLKVVGANWIYGDRHTLSKRPIRKPSDFAGLKIRVPNNLIQVKGMEVMGATPTPLPLGEVYTALQQGVVEAVENPLPVLYNGKFHEVAKYLTLDAHIKNFTTLVMGAKFFNKLTDEQKQILIDTCKEAADFNNKLQLKLADDMIAKFKKEGVTVITVDINEFKAKAKSFYSLPDFTSKWSKGLYQTVEKEMTPAKKAKK
ncbi:MAG: C4-dicarboxylate TRAP transporter substrate-binding protein [Elusimicrobiota bacterium]|jgi:tripartite ATP-independent transporter DctP family solute receptor|nr:C4-dicarboxylate TRAP transporter substrate-binding protein [Elusimicrobiota bacterium]